MKDALAPAFLRRKYTKIVLYDYPNPAIEESVIKKKTCGYCQPFLVQLTVKKVIKSYTTIDQNLQVPQFKRSRPRMFQEHVKQRDE